MDPNRNRNPNPNPSPSPSPSPNPNQVYEQRVEDDAEVEHVPRLPEVRARPVGHEAHGDHLDRELCDEAQSEDRVEAREQRGGGRGLVEQRRVDGEAHLRVRVSVRVRVRVRVRVDGEAHLRLG